MPLFEIGYRRYQGARTPASMRWWPITLTGLSLAWRNKLLRRLVYVAYLPLMYFAPVFFAIGRATEPGAELDAFSRAIGEGLLSKRLLDQLQEDPSGVRTAVWALVFAFFLTKIQLLLALIVAVVVAPPLVSNDLRTRAFLIYFARPVSRVDYLIGKLGVLVGLLGAVTLLPSVALYALSIVFSPSLDTILQTLPVLGSVVVSSVAVILPIAAVSLLISSLTTQQRFAAVGWIVVCVFGSFAYGLLAASVGQGSAGWTFLLSLPVTIWTLQLSIFDLPGRLGRVEGSQHLQVLVREYSTDNSSALALAALCVLVALCLIALYRRTGAPTRI